MSGHRRRRNVAARARLALEALLGHRHALLLENLQRDALGSRFLDLVQHVHHVPVRRVRIRLHRRNQVAVLSQLLPAG